MIKTLCIVMSVAVLGQLNLVGKITPEPHAEQVINSQLASVPDEWFDLYDGTVEFRPNNDLKDIRGSNDGQGHIWCEFTAHTLTHEIAHSIYRIEVGEWDAAKRQLFEELKAEYLQIDAERMAWYYVNEPYDISGECYAEMASIYYTKDLSNYPEDFVNKLTKFFS